MPVRLLKPFEGQAAGTLYWTPDANQERLKSLGIADDQIQLASDYGEGWSRRVTVAAANTSSTARVYHMNSGSAQALTVNLAGLKQDDVLTIVQEGAGKTTLTAATGTTLNTALSTLVTSGQYAVAQILVTGPNTGIAFGGLGG